MAAASSVDEGQVFGCHSIGEWEEHFKNGLQSKKLVVIDFTATWCGPCRFIAPVFADLAKKAPHVIFLKVDVDELKTVAEEFKVEAMPTFLFLKEGKEVARIVGADKVGLEKAVAEHGTLSASA